MKNGGAGTPPSEYAPFRLWSKRWERDDFATLLSKLTKLSKVMNKNGEPKQAVLFIMRLLLLQSLLLLTCISCCFAGKADGQEVLDKKVSLNLPGREIKYVLRSITASTAIGFTYSNNILPGKQKVTVIANEEKLGEVLEKIFKPLHISFEVIGQQIVLKKDASQTVTGTGLLPADPSENPFKLILGTVVGPDGTPLQGVSVTVAGTTRGTTTDEKGHFQLQANEGDMLIFSSVGFVIYRAKVGASGEINVTLTKSENSMGEVVVTALGISKQKRAVGYAMEQISGKEVQASNSPNVIDALHGKMADVMVTDPNGDGSGTSHIVIRGNNVLSPDGDNQPLIIVDGVQINNQSSYSSTGESPYASQNVVDANRNNTNSGQDWGSGVNDINAYDIESMSVLKGPAAAALYGFRGANGAIIITTKKGSQKKGLGIEYNFSYMATKIYKTQDFQNEFGVGPGGNPEIYSGAQNGANYSALSYGILPFPTDASGTKLSPYMSGDPSESWGPKMDGTLVKWWDGKMHPFSPIPESQVVKDVFRTGSTVSHNVSFSGASDKGTIRLSFTRLDFMSILPNVDRYMNTVNLGGSLFVSKRVKTNVAISYFDGQRHNAGFLGDDYNGASPVSVFKNLSYYWPRGYNLGLEKNNYQNADGTINYNGFPNSNNFASTLGYYPYNGNGGAGSFYWSRYNDNTERQERRIIGSISLAYDITDWLNLTVTSGIDDQNVDNETKNKPWDETGILNGSYSRLTGTLIRQNNDALLTYHKEDIADMFDIRAVAGASTLSINDYSNSASSGTWVQPFQYTLNNNSFGTPQSATEAYNQQQTNSVYGFIDAGYKKFLYLDVTGRNDWASTLPVNHWSYFYPSVSGSFVFSELMKKRPSWFNFGKIKAALSKAANPPLPYIINNYYNPTVFAGQPAATLPTTVPPLNLVPQTAKSFELGTTLQFIENRISLDFTVYSTHSINQIYSPPLAASTGATGQTTNAGELDNKGYSVILKLSPIRTKDFSWDVNFNMNHNKSVVESIGNGATYLELGNIWGGNGPTIAARPGDAYGTIYGWGYVYDPATNKPILDAQGQFYQTTGMIPFTMQHGRAYYDPKAGTTGRVPVGNATPRWTGGVNTTLKYKNFSLYGLVDIKMGGDMWFGDYGTAMTQGLSPRTLYEREGHGLPLQVTDPTGATHTYNIGVIKPGVTVDPSNTQNFIANNNVVSYIYKYAEYSNWGAGLLTSNAVMDDSWVSLRELSVSYDLPADMVRKTKIFQNLSVSLVGRNLFYIYSNAPDHINPLSNGAGNAQGIEFGTAPRQRNYGVSIRTAF